jgi:hypothetical protein
MPSLSAFEVSDMLVTTTELERYMDIKFSNRQLYAAEYVLEGLQSELEAYLRRPVETQLFTEIYKVESNNVGIPNSSFFYDYSLDTTGNVLSFLQPPYTVYLRNSPVHSVSSMTVTGPVPDGAPVSLTEGTDFVVRRYGVDVYRTFANDTINITYSAGLDGPEIKMMRLAILRAGAREMQNMHDDVVGIRDLETRNTAPLTTGFTPEEIASFRRWRRVRVS